MAVMTGTNRNRRRPETESAEEAERHTMLRMPDPVHPDLPCLFAGAIVPALCSAVIPDAWQLERVNSTA